mmetsp:Transcript_96074/g.266935  ORF Transcript_96074/g.266935 Transcript_96074/m.266935 type:complete len:212 (+) Transcript_96074:988-1623(+)
MLAIFASSTTSPPASSHSSRRSRSIEAMRSAASSGAEMHCFRRARLFHASSIRFSMRLRMSSRPRRPPGSSGGSFRVVFLSRPRSSLHFSFSASLRSDRPPTPMTGPADAMNSSKDCKRWGCERAWRFSCVEPWSEWWWKDDAAGLAVCGGGRTDAPGRGMLGGMGTSLLGTPRALCGPAAAGFSSGATPSLAAPELTAGRPRPSSGEAAG